MGLDATIYVGPYIEASSMVQREVTRSVDGCLNTECTLYGQSQYSNCIYCPRCGKKTGHGQQRVTESVDWYEVSEAIDEALSETHREGSEDDGAHRWIPNVKRDGETERKMYFANDYEAGAWPVEAGAISAEIEWMRAAFSPEIERMREFYASIEVKWGVLVWWS